VISSSMVLRSKKNKGTFQPLKIKPLCHVKMSETNYPVTWHHISEEQRPQLQHCKSQKSHTSTNMAMMQNIWGYIQQFHVQGYLKIWKCTEIKKEVEHGCHEDWYYWRLEYRFTECHSKRDSLKHCGKLPMLPDFMTPGV
jgi:hypothetical protein